MTNPNNSNLIPVITHTVRTKVRHSKTKSAVSEQVRQSETKSESNSEIRAVSVVRRVSGALCTL